MTQGEDVVNLFLQLERVFSHEPWTRWFAWHNMYATHRRIEPVMPNYMAIRQAWQMMGGVSEPPMIGHNDMFGYGCTVRPNYTPAIVSFDHYISSKLANIILWHELRHARQHEQEGLMCSNGSTIPGLVDNPSVYWNHPDEVDARVWEKYGIDIPLVNEAQGYVPTFIHI